MAKKKPTGRWEMITTNTDCIPSHGISSITLFATEEEAKNAADRYNVNHMDDPRKGAYVRPEYEMV